MKRVPLFLALPVLWAGAVFAGPFDLGDAATLPANGIRLRVLEGMTLQMLSLPNAAGTRKSDGEKVFQEPVWWRWKQTCGCWKGPAGLIWMGEILHNPPASDKELLTSGELERKYAAPVNESDWDEEKLKAWTAYYTDTEVHDFKAEKQQPGSRTIRYSFRVGNCSGFLIRPADDASRWHLVLYSIKDSLSKPAQRAVSRSVASIAFVAPRENRHLARSAAGQQEDASNTYKASRNRVIESIRNFPGWWYIESENYIFVSNQTGRREVTRLRNELEEARKVFRQYCPPPGELQTAAVVRIFKTREEYVSFVGKRMEWSIGVFMPAKGELAVSPPPEEERSNQKQRESLRQTMFHEGFHQYLHQIYKGRQSSVWFNEGLAQFFEGVDLRQGSIRLSDTEEDRLHDFFKSPVKIDLKALTVMSYETFYGTNTERNYLMAKALLYYLMKGASSEGKTAYAAIPARYAAALKKTGDADDATRRAFEGVNFDQLSADLRRFFSNHGSIRSSYRYNPLTGKTH